MSDPITPPRVPGAAHVKGLGGKLKGLPPWAYVAAIGVGGAAVWFGIHRANTAAVSDAADVSGDTGGTLSATTGGDAYPVGSQGAGYYSDPTTGTGNTAPSLDDQLDTFAKLQTLFGGGTQSSASAEDHYTPPAITINIPDSAMPQAPAQSTPAAPAPSVQTPKKDKCTGEYPFESTSGTRKGMCYKIVFAGPKKTRSRKYTNGDVVPDPA